MSIFKSKNNTSRQTPSTVSSGSNPNPAGERIRSKQPFSAVPLEQRRQGQSHVPLDALLKAYDDYPALVKDLENTTEQLHLSSEESVAAHRKIATLNGLLQTEKNDRAQDKIDAEERKRLSEKEVERRVRAELEPKIAELERVLKETKGERDSARKEVKERKEKGEGWIKALEEMGRESEKQSEREAAVAEERRKTAERGRELHSKILEGLRGVEGKEAGVGANGIGSGNEGVATSGEKASSTPFGKNGTNGDGEKKQRKYDIAD